MTPRTVEQYLDQLRDAMRDDDSALRQDALYDAEEYLRSELAEQPGRLEADVLADIVASYGAPAEVAAAYRQTEETVAKALHTPTKVPTQNPFGAVFGVFVDPRTYASMFYMLLALATGIVYFTVAITGLSLSLGLAITLIGIPFFLLFLAFVRVLSLLEGRVVETMLGVRMPRRPLYSNRDKGLIARIGNMLTDPRTWTTLLYMVIQLPLGIAYFATVVVGFTVSLTALVSPLIYHFGMGLVRMDGISFFYTPGTVATFWQVWIVAILGFIGLLAMMHLCRMIGHLHGGVAKYLLVRP